MRTTEPFVPIPEDVIPQMLSLASLKPNERLVDLGSGDGRIVIAAAKLFGANAVGVDVRGALVKACQRRVREMGLSGRVKVSRRNFRDVSLRKADVVALYLSSYTLGLLAPKFTRELRRGSRVVTFDFPIFGWKSARELSFTPKGWKKAHPIYLYLV